MNFDKDEYLLNMGKRIKQLRLNLNLSQDELSKRCGYTSRSSMNKIELGLNDLPQSKLKIIAEVLGTTTTYLTGAEEISSISNVTQIKKELNGFQFALYDEIDEFSEVELEDLKLAVDLIKARRRSNNE